MAIALAATIASEGAARGAAYFVNKQGSDVGNGRSRERAFLTIQKGVDALKAGDVLTIGPGEYEENVFRADLGNAEVETLIRAEIPGTVVLRGDRPAPEFKKLAGHRFVYATRFEREPEAVLEHATMSILERKPVFAELDFEPGSMFYDVEAKTLYISTADLRAPAGRRYSIAVKGGSGLVLDTPTRVTVEGLSATGHYCTMVRAVGARNWIPSYQWGIALDRPTSCTLRDCAAWLNCGGIVLHNGRGNRVERCLAHHNRLYNIQSFGGPDSADNLIADCTAYEGQSGINAYTTFSGPMRFRNCVTWGHHLDYSTKGQNGKEFAFLENCVSLDNIRAYNLRNSIIGGRCNSYRFQADYASDNIAFGNETDLELDREFADPVNMDWRLQGDSRFRNAREDGKDRGLFPEHGDRVFFLGPNGDDDNSGTSMRHAWQTLGRALGKLQPGDTLYLAPGVYTAGGEASLGRAGAGKIHIRGRGRARAVIQGDVYVSASAGVEFERVDFAGAVHVQGGHDMAFRHCTFEGLRAQATKDLTVTHALFVAEPLRLSDATGVYLSGNIYANADGPAVVLDGDGGIRYSDYNSYSDGAHCWAVAGKKRSIETLRERHDRHSEVLAPEIVAGTHGAPEVKDAGIVAGRGPQGTALGRHQPYREQSAGLIGPFLHSVGETTANIEWWTTTPAAVEVAWGQPPDMTHRVKIDSPARFTSFSLGGLEPDCSYALEIRSLQRPSNRAGAPRPLTKITAGTLTFTTTRAAPEPAVYYVAPEGDDAHTGLSREKAWRSVGHAAGQVKAGDTVLLAGGTYQETVRVRASGEPGKPITFRPMPGAKVVFDGRDRTLSHAFVVFKKDHIHLDGFHFKDHGVLPGGAAVIQLDYARHIRVTRCFSDGRGPGYAARLLGARHCAEVTARNCVSVASMGSAMHIVDSPNTLIENNVFLQNLITACVLGNEPDQKIVMRRNVFADSLPFKALVPYFEIGKIESLEENDNCYYMRLPDEERKMFLFYGEAAYERVAQPNGMRTEFDAPPVFSTLARIGLAEFKAIKGETGSFFGNPGFKGTVGMAQGETTMSRGREYPVLLSDKLVRKHDLDFPDVFATDPRAVEKGIGLVPAEFEDFGFAKVNNG
ncbi:MAG: hypothetical protein JXR37_17450 [Kiritimatiellae bacterium]|nr:hypothetical protein [Kiritimatiellia bacterium]